MITKIVISSGDEQKIIKKSLAGYVPPRQIHRNKKAYLRRTKYKKQEND